MITEEDPSSPLGKTHIGPEKLLSLFSEMNWNDYCLSYLLTNRDFSGVLGLAWEGKPGNFSPSTLDGSQHKPPQWRPQQMSRGGILLYSMLVDWAYASFRPLVCDLYPQFSLTRHDIEAKLSDNITQTLDTLLKDCSVNGGGLGVGWWSLGSTSRKECALM